MERKNKGMLVFGLIVTFILFSFIHFISAQPDITPPTIYEIWASPTEVEDGDYVTIYVNASDDLSGINSIFFQFKNNLSSQDLNFWTDGINFTNTPQVKSGKLYIPPYSVNSTWYLFFLNTSTACCGDKSVKY
jgi:hypothetical protein